jgi:hypothetical protein
MAALGFNWPVTTGVQVYAVTRPAPLSRNRHRDARGRQPRPELALLPPAGDRPRIRNGLLRRRRRAGAPRLGSPHRPNFIVLPVGAVL